MRIVIVEDETQIRNGLAKLVERISKSYHVVGCAANGLQGLSCIKEQHPDVVITDVRMPEMDGLEMIGALTAAGSTTKFIIISAYSEFSYAKQAISFGVSEYLLKPASMAELAQSLRKLELELQESSVQLEVHSLDAAIRRLVLRDGGLDDEGRQQIARKYLLEEKRVFALALFYFGDRYEVARDAVSRLTCQKFQGECSTVCAIPMESRRAILYVLSDVESRPRFAAWLGSSARIHAQTMWMGADISLGFCDHYTALHETAMGLLDAMPWRLSLPKEPLLQWPEVLQTPTSHCAYPIEIEQQMRAAVCSRSETKIQQEFQRFLQYFSGDTVYAPTEIRECYTRFLWAAFNLAKEVNLFTAARVESQRMMEELLDAQNLAELNQVATHLLNALQKATEDGNEDEVSITILRAKSLIHEFYSTGITLDEMAVRLNLTPEYLSTQFHRDTGVTFSTYIRDYRISKAKELLLGTQLKLHQVAMQVGYADPKYFSQVFKKVTGQLPAEYRRSKQ